MATYVLIHGAAHGAWCWDLLAGELQKRGHDVVAMDLPSDDETAGLSEHADAVVDAISDRTDLVVVAHSLGSLTAPHVCDRVAVDLLVLLAGMVPSPGQTGEQLLAEAGANSDEPERGGEDGTTSAVDPTIAYFYSDVPSGLAAEAVTKLREQASAPLREPWPRDAWPDVPTRYLLCRDDRVLPAGWLRRVIPERLGIAPDEIDGSHSPFLSRPKELADRLEAWYRAERRSGRR